MTVFSLLGQEITAVDEQVRVGELAKSIIDFTAHKDCPHTRDRWDEIWTCMDCFDEKIKQSLIAWGNARYAEGVEQAGIDHCNGFHDGFRAGVEASAKVAEETEKRADSYNLYRLARFEIVRAIRSLLPSVDPTPAPTNKETGTTTDNTGGK